MGTYLNPGSGAFEKAINSEIYIDKTNLLDYLNQVINTEQGYIAVSRPRRFGKSMTVNMICAYYDRTINSKPLFASYQIAQTKHFEQWINEFDVIRINMVEFLGKTGNVAAMLERMQKLVARDILKQYPDVDYFDRLDIQQMMSDIYQDTGRQFVIVIDEWDCVFRELTGEEHEKEQKAYLDFLRDWLKDKEYVALAYITGILPIKKYGKHSALNMFREFAMTSPKQLAEYTGFVEEEIQDICECYGIKWQEIKEWYDGYLLSNKPDLNLLEKEDSEGKVYHIYSPLSVVEAVTNKQLGNYWNRTETYEALRKQINRNFDGLKELVALLMKGNHLAVNVETYQNDMTTFHSADDVLTMLIHLGYLGYDSEKRQVFIPNKEIMAVYKDSAQGEEWNHLYAKLEASQRLLEATWKGDQATVARLVEAAHQKAGNQTYNSEIALSYAIRLAYFNAEQFYTLIPEMQAGKGYADLAYIPSPQYIDKPAMLIELKYNKDADTAIDQIKRQQYPESLEHYKGNIILVGINYDRDVSNEQEGFKHHSCVIERV